MKWEHENPACELVEVQGHNNPFPELEIERADLLITVRAGCSEYEIGDEQFVEIGVSKVELHIQLNGVSIEPDTRLGEPLVDQAVVSKVNERKSSKRHLSFWGRLGGKLSPTEMTPHVEVDVGGGIKGGFERSSEKEYNEVIRRVVAKSGDRWFIQKEGAVLDGTFLNNMKLCSIIHAPDDAGRNRRSLSISAMIPRRNFQIVSASRENGVRRDRLFGTNKRKLLKLTIDNYFLDLLDSGPNRTSIVLSRVEATDD